MGYVLPIVAVFLMYLAVPATVGMLLAAAAFLRWHKAFLAVLAVLFSIPASVGGSLICDTMAQAQQLAEKERAGEHYLSRAMTIGRTRLPAGTTLSERNDSVWNVDFPDPISVEGVAIDPPFGITRDRGLLSGPAHLPKAGTFGPVHCAAGDADFDKGSVTECRLA